MKITQVSFGFTKNMGNFQSARVEVVVDCNEHSLDDPDKAIMLACAFVNEALDLPIDAEDKELLASHRQYIRVQRDDTIERSR